MTFPSLSMTMTGHTIIAVIGFKSVSPIPLRHVSVIHDNHQDLPRGYGHQNKQKGPFVEVLLPYGYYLINHQSLGSNGSGVEWRRHPENIP